jgi:hypothetical protein
VYLNGGRKCGKENLVKPTFKASQGRGVNYVTRELIPNRNRDK